MSSQNPTCIKTKRLQEIACQQVLADDSSVFSIQWSDLPQTIAGNISAEQLISRYLQYIKKCTLTLIRPIILDSGVEFRLAGSAISLITFLPPVYTHDSVTLYICGGFLVQPHQCDRGELRFGVERLSENIRLSIELSDFCPLILGNQSPSLLRLLLYRFTQAAIHRLVTVRFLSMLYEELFGHSVKTKVINAAVRSGKPV